MAIAAEAADIEFKEVTILPDAVQEKRCQVFTFDSEALRGFSRIGEVARNQLLKVPKKMVPRIFFLFRFDFSFFTFQVSSFFMRSDNSSISFRPRQMLE